MATEKSPKIILNRNDVEKSQGTDISLKSKGKRKRNESKNESCVRVTRTQTRSQTLRGSNEEPASKKQRTESSVQIAIRSNIPTRRRLVKMPKPTLNALMAPLKQYELVWAYIRGFPSWPAVIEKILPNGKFLVHFFGDYTRAEVARRNILNYFEGFNQFSCNFGNIKLQKAVEEAKFLLFERSYPTECFVCKVLECKRQFLLNRAINSNVTNGE